MPCTDSLLIPEATLSIQIPENFSLKHMHDAPVSAGSLE